MRVPRRDAKARGPFPELSEPSYQGTVKNAVNKSSTECETARPQATKLRFSAARRTALPLCMRNPGRTPPAYSPGVAASSLWQNASLIRKQTLKEGNEDLRERWPHRRPPRLSREASARVYFTDTLGSGIPRTRGSRKRAAIIGCPFSGLILRRRIPGRYSSRRDKVAARSWKEASSTRRRAVARDGA